MAIPTTEPAEITAGDTASWKKSLPDYPAGDGWQLTYVLVSTSVQIEITAAPEGDDHLVSVSAAVSAGWAPGAYRWQAHVTRVGERHTVATGRLTVRPDFATQTDGYDDRSHAEKVLEAIEALIVGRASKVQMSYTIRGRTLQYLSPAELLTWRDTYRAEVVRERRAARMRKGLGHNGIIKVRL